MSARPPLAERIAYQARDVAQRQRIRNGHLRAGRDKAAETAARQLAISAAILADLRAQAGSLRP